MFYPHQALKKVLDLIYGMIFNFIFHCVTMDTLNRGVILKPTSSYWALQLCHHTEIGADPGFLFGGVHQ